MSEQNTLKELVIDVLKTIYDPEIPVNLMDLGLIYDISILGNAVQIRMTLTNPGCPVAAQFPEVVKSHIAAIPEISTVSVELVWEPAWTTDLMSESAKLQLGLL